MTPEIRLLPRSVRRKMNFQPIPYYVGCGVTAKFSKGYLNVAELLWQDTAPIEFMGHLMKKLDGSQEWVAHGDKI